MLESFISELQRNLITQVAVAVTVLVGVLGVVYAALQPRMFLLMAKNLSRNKVRTILTCVATMILVFMVIMVWTVLNFIEAQTQEKSKDFKLIITEAWQLPSRMPAGYKDVFSPVAMDYEGNYQTDARGEFIPNPQFIFKDHPELNIGPKDFMMWSFYGGTTAKGVKPSIENILFFFAMVPEQIKPMMDELDDVPDEYIKKLKDTPNGCFLGQERLDALNLKVGGTFTIYSFNYKEIDLDFEILGVLPGSRYNRSAVMNYSYLSRALGQWSAKNKGKTHPAGEKPLNLIWLRVRDKETFAKVGQIIEKESKSRLEIPVKCETAASGVGSFLDAFRDIFTGVKYILVPVVLFSMILIISNAISISVRERRAEMAVLKVLGFKPGQIMNLVLGESMLVGALSGFLAAVIAALIFNVFLDGINFQIAFFPAFPVPASALFWGIGMGSLTAFLGSVAPSWTARSVKVSEVFSKVA